MTRQTIRGFQSFVREANPLRQDDPPTAPWLAWGPISPLGRAVAVLAFFLTAYPSNAAEEFEGRFLRLYWYERDTAYNPHFERRFRVNAAEAVLHPEFGRRVEARENG